MNLFLINSLIPLIFILGGFITLKFPPKEINSLYGYRTARSMRSKEAWSAANRFASILMIAGGADLFFINLILYWMGIKNEIIWAAVMLIGVIAISVIVYFLTEKFLKENFDEDGKPLNS